MTHPAATPQARRPLPQPSPPAAWALGPGQSEWLQVRRGARICLHEGQLRLHEPALWLAEGLWQPVHVLHAGEMHTVEQPGWLRLETGAPCCVSMQPPPSPWQRWMGSARCCREFLISRLRPHARIAR